MEVGSWPIVRMQNLSRKLALDDTYGVAATAYENNREFTLSANSCHSLFLPSRRSEGRSALRPAVRAGSARRP